MTPKLPCFYIANGELSAYGLACGYVERHDNGPTTTVLFAEGGVYHVRQTVKLDDEPMSRICWEVFDFLNDARKFYRRTLRNS